MAAVTTTLLFSEGGADKVALFRCPKVNSADTVDVSTWFATVKTADARAVTSLLAAFAIAVTGQGGTVLTLTQANLAGDGVYLFVTGAAA